jgi:cysteine-rich repeat protein
VEYERHLPRHRARRDLGDAAAITANYFQRNETFMRWYVHGEGGVTTFPGVTTSNEWLVSCPAVLFSNCGNGQVDAGEQCDNGKLDTSDGCNEFCDFGAASGANCALCDLLSSLW